MRRFFALLLVACAIASCGQRAPTAPVRAPDLVRTGWFLSMPVNLNVLMPRQAGGTGPEAASERTPDVKIYITAPIREGRGFTAEAIRIPAPQGERVLPPHDDTLTRLVGPGENVDAIGYFVVPGPTASPDTVRADDAPADSIVGAPLARRINVAGEWVNLNNHVIIEYGVRAGLLGLVEFQYGGAIWTTHVDTGMAGFRASATVR